MEAGESTSLSPLLLNPVSLTTAVPLTVPPDVLHPVLPDVLPAACALLPAVAGAAGLGAVVLPGVPLLPSGVLLLLPLLPGPSATSTSFSSQPRL